jgi:two-component system chemotaxis sensor kinase CheA
MSIDMSQFYQVFFDEAAEHLASMESLLLALDLDAPDPDQLNAIFRAAHSIKGGSGTFGFTDMAAVTHILETLLDRVRKNEITLTHDMVDAFLQAGDALRDLLIAHQNGSIADEAVSIAICAKLEKLTAEGSPQAPVKGMPPVLTAEDSMQSTSSAAAESSSNPSANEDQSYGFFAETDGIKSEAEKMQGYGFFAEPAAIRSGLENAQGYGFFDEPEAIKSGVENAQGYGFFTEVESRSYVPPPAISARKDDVPGRRATDRAVAATVGENSIRVGVGKVDNLVNLVGELVITQAMLTETVSKLDPVIYERLLSGMAQLDRNTRDLQESVMSVRMMPISLVFSRFQRVVRDNAVKLNKKVQLKIIGENTELDKGLIEKISDPITHLVRNSLDHGIELPAERIAQGKDPQGTITLRAAHQGGSIIIEVSDDGAGLSRERILAKAREKNMPVSDSMSDTEVWQMIFAPGFSTAAVVTDVSGRGVGMDVVKRNIESISGRIEINSVLGQGSAMTIRLPLTLAILDGLSIAVGNQIYLVPLGFISESLQPNPGDIKEISGQGAVVHVRGEYLPLIALHKLFNIEPKITNPAEGILVLLEAEGKKIALLVDELVGQYQVVIKSLETNYRKVPGISGATIMGDGRVALIIDVGALVKLAQL